MARVILPIRDDDPRTSWRDKNKIRMRHAQPFPAIRADFVRFEGDGPIELTNDIDEHTPDFIPFDGG